MVNPPGQVSDKEGRKDCGAEKELRRRTKRFGLKIGHWVIFNRLLIRTGLADTTGRIQVIFFFFHSFYIRLLLRYTVGS